MGSLLAGCNEPVPPANERLSERAEAKHDGLATPDDEPGRALFEFRSTDEGAYGVTSETYQAAVVKTSVSLSAVRDSTWSTPLHFDSSVLERAGFQARFEGSMPELHDGDLLWTADDVAATLHASEAGLLGEWVLPNNPPGTGDLVLTLQLSGGLESGPDTQHGLHYLDPATGPGARVSANWHASGADTVLEVEGDETKITIRVPESIVDSAGYPASVALTFAPMAGVDEPLTVPIPASLEAATAALQDGTFVVWAHNESGSGTDIFGLRLKADGEPEWDEPLRISTSLANDLAPRVASDGSKVLAVWRTSASDGRDEIRAAVLVDRGDLLEVEFSIAQAEHPLGDPEVVWNGQNFQVMWLEGETLHWAVVPPGGNTTVRSSLEARGALGRPAAVRMDGTESAFVAIATQRANESGLYTFLFDAAGNLKHEQDAVCLDDVRKRNPAVASEGSEFLVAWEGQEPGSEEVGIHATRVNADLQLMGECFQRVTTSEKNHFRPAFLAFEGKAFLAWNEPASGTISVGILDGMEIAEETVVAEEMWSRFSTPALFAVGNSHVGVLWADASRGVRADLVRVTFDFGLVPNLPPHIIFALQPVQTAAATAFADGRHLVVWQEKSLFLAGDFEVRGALYGEDGTRVVAPFTIAGGDGFQGEPAVAADESGGFFVVWQDMNRMVLGARVSSTGTVAAPVLVYHAQTGTKVVRPRIARGNQAQHLVTWTNQPRLASSVVQAAFLVNGSPQASFVVAMGSSARTPDVAFLKSGFVVVFERAPALDTSIFATLVPPGGCLAGGCSSWTVQPGTLRHGRRPAIAASANGFLVAFEGTGLGWTSGANIYAVTLGYDGKPGSTPHVAVAETNAQETYPAVAYDGQDYVVAYQQERRILSPWIFPGIGGSDIYGARVSNAGAGETHVIPMSFAAGAENEVGPALSASAPFRLLLAHQLQHRTAGTSRVRTQAITWDNQGQQCRTDGDCVSGFCVDGVCCDSACGDGDASDCQACSVQAGASVDGTCGPVGAGPPCRGSSGVCDVAEVCDGISIVCPPDEVAPDGTACRAATGACDVEDTCDGIRPTCGEDLVAPALVSCRPSAGACDDPEYCDGFNSSCGPDGYDRDKDGDGVPDGCDNCPRAGNPSQADQDGDGYGDACDDDDDGDGYRDEFDPCPGVAGDRSDRDGDGIGDACDPCPDGPNVDTDGDGFLDCMDTCPNVPDAAQLDTDGDGVGDACDVCPTIADAHQRDFDGDGLGDACDPDADDDGVDDSIDNCALLDNGSQLDSDGDGIGDACDNCAYVPNASQTDRDGDGIGDQCGFTLNEPRDGVQYSEHEAGWSLRVRGSFVGHPLGALSMTIDGQPVSASLAGNQLIADVPLSTGEHTLVATLTTPNAVNTINRTFHVFSIGSIERIATLPGRQVLLPSTQAEVGILVRDRSGTPVNGVPVTARIWDQAGRSSEIAMRSGEIATASSIASAHGRDLAVTEVRSNGNIGEVRIIFESPATKGHSLGFDFFVDAQPTLSYRVLSDPPCPPGPPARIWIGGDQQLGIAGERFDEPLVIRVLDAAGCPVPNVQLRLTTDWAAERDGIPGFSSGDDAGGFQPYGPADVVNGLHERTDLITDSNGEATTDFWAARWTVPQIYTDPYDGLNYLSRGVGRYGPVDLIALRRLVDAHPHPTYVRQHMLTALAIDYVPPGGLNPVPVPSPVANYVFLFAAPGPAARFERTTLSNEIGYHLTHPLRATSLHRNNLLADQWGNPIANATVRIASVAPAGGVVPESEPPREPFPDEAVPQFETVTDQNGSVSGYVIAADRMDTAFSATASVLSSPTGMTNVPTVTWNGTTTNRFQRGESSMNDGQDYYWLDGDVFDEFDLAGGQIGPEVVNTVKLTCFGDGASRCDDFTGFFTAERDTQPVQVRVYSPLLGTINVLTENGTTPPIYLESPNAGLFDIYIYAYHSRYDPRGLFDRPLVLEAAAYHPSGVRMLCGGQDCKHGQSVDPFTILPNEHRMMYVRFSDDLFYAPPSAVLGARVSYGYTYLSPWPENALERDFRIDRGAVVDLQIWNGPFNCPAEVELYDANDPDQMTLLRLPINQNAGIRSASVEHDGPSNGLIPLGKPIRFTTVVNAPSCSNLSYEWIFSNENGVEATSSAATPTHTFQEPGTSTVSVSLTCDSCPGSRVVASTEIRSFRLSVAYPTGDPTSDTPKSSEITLWGPDGTVEVPIEAKIEPVEFEPDVAPQLRWTFVAGSRNDALPQGTSLTWANPLPNDPTAGTGSPTVATFAGYPTNQDAFGPRTLRLEYLEPDTGTVLVTREQALELFFDKYAIAASRDVPNWFYYWLQEMQPASMYQILYKGFDPGGADPIFGVAPAMYHWNYSSMQYSKDTVFVFDTAGEEADSLGCTGGQILTGIDWFLSLVQHELRHLDQIKAGDAAVATGTPGPWRYGWSWNQAGHNHWHVGTDGVPGAPGNDNSSPLDNDILVHWGPGELGFGCTPSSPCADVPLFDWNDPDRDWPLALGALPNCVPPPSESVTYVEIDARDREAKVDNGYAEKDWANPGKKHKTPAYAD